MSKLRTVFFFVASLLVAASSQGQLVPISLQQRVINSDVIFEGKVIDQTASWDENRRHIYTSNIISVYKVFKGELKSSTVELITMGGTVGNEREDVSYGLKLNEGAVGVFTCVPNTIKLGRGSKYSRLRPYSEIQGFIHYDLAKGNAKDMFHVYKNVSDEVYSAVQKFTNTKYKVLNKADFKIK
jgi:hypothetical protein